MSFLDEDITLFDAYVSGNMSGDELSNFENRLKSDESFAETFQLYKSSVNATKIAGFMNEAREVISDKQVENQNQYSFPWMAIAATLTILLVAYLFFFKVGGDDEKLSFNDAFQPYPNILQNRSSEANTLNSALRAYQKGEYESAITKFSELAVQSDTTKFYKGMSQLSLNSFSEAIGTLNSIKKDNSIFNQQINWYTGLAYYGNNNLVLAIKQLSEIGEGEFNYELAQKILHTLE